MRISQNQNCGIDLETIGISNREIIRESIGFEFNIDISVAFSKQRIIGNNAQSLEIASVNRVTFSIIKIGRNNRESSIKSMNVIYNRDQVLAKSGSIYFCTTKCKGQ